MAAGTPPPPDFVVIGAMRAGTTSLHDMLARHPDIRLPNLKETDFFLGREAWARGPASYASLYGKGGGVRGDISPNYSKCHVFPGVPDRMARIRPDARIIYIVRDPVDRALSEFRHAVAMSRSIRPPSEWTGDAEGLSILGSSAYGRQYAAWADHFPSDQILVVDFDALTATPANVVNRIFEHIGVTVDLGTPVLPRRNAGEDLMALPPIWQSLRQKWVGHMLRTHVPRTVQSWLKRSVGRKPLPPSTGVTDGERAAIADALRADVAEFRRLTGQAFSHWSV